MHRPGKRLVRALLVACTLAAFLATTAASAPSSHSKHFGLRGSISGLYPGGELPMTVKITNPYKHPIVVLKIRVTAKSSNRKGCKARLVTSPGWNGRLRVPKRGTRKVTVPVRLSPTAPRACVGATFKLSLTGKATRP